MAVNPLLTAKAQKPPNAGTKALGVTANRSWLSRVAKRQVAPPHVLAVAIAAGLLLYLAIGFAGIVGGEEFLDYAALDHHDPLHGQHRGIFWIELGVGITVAATMISIVLALVGRRPPA